MHAFCHISTTTFLQLRFVRVGPARARPSKGKNTSKSAVLGDGDSSDEGFVLPSEVEENDDDLAHYLQSDSSFIMNMHATAAFSASWLALGLLWVAALWDFILSGKSNLLWALGSDTCSPILLRMFQGSLANICPRAPCMSCSISTAAGVGPMGSWSKLRNLLQQKMIKSFASTMVIMNAQCLCFV